MGSPGLPPRPRDPLGDALRLRTAALTPLATRFAARAALSSPSLLVLLVSASRRANFWLEIYGWKCSFLETLPRSRGREKRRGSITHHRPAINRLAQRATRRAIAMVERERKRARVGFAMALAMLAGAMLAGGARAGSTRRFLISQAERDPARMAERVESAEMITPFRGAGPYDIVREFYEWEYDNHTSRGYLFTPVARNDKGVVTRIKDKKFPALVFGHGLVSPFSLSWLSSFLLTSDPLSTRRGQKCAKADFYEHMTTVLSSWGYVVLVTNEFSECDYRNFLPGGEQVNTTEYVGELTRNAKYLASGKSPPPLLSRCILTSLSFAPAAPRRRPRRPRRRRRPTQEQWRRPTPLPLRWLGTPWGAAGPLAQRPCSRSLTRASSRLSSLSPPGTVYNPCLLHRFQSLGRLLLC